MTDAGKHEASKNKTEPVKVKVEFTGGLEILFANKRTHSVEVPRSGKQKPTVGELVTHLAEHYLTATSKKNLFVLDGSVRPGILVLINDADWELEGEAAYELEQGDEIVFVSTLHGG